MLSLLSIPIHLPEGYTFEVELYDDASDAGAAFYLHGPADSDERLHIGTHDAHPRLSVLRWFEAKDVCAAARREPRNRRSRVDCGALLLIWPVIGLADDDPLDEVRHALAAAWRGIGLDACAAEEALDAEVGAGSGWEAHAELGWLSRNDYSRRRRDAERGFRPSEFARLRRFLEAMRA